jgi:methylated-DNA-protein-cysteine methyltransferase-like protein
MPARRRRLDRGPFRRVETHVPRAGRKVGPRAPPGDGRDFVGATHGGTVSRCRAVISKIPRGKVITYGGVAMAAGRPGAARMTVRALRGADGLPWHRVVGAGGRIALHGVDGQEQRLRLEMEGIRFRGNRVRMEVHEWTPRSPPSARAREQRRAGTTDPDFYAGLAAPARRALTSKGIDTIAKLAGYTERELRQFHGIGPSSIPKLHRALRTAGLEFRPDERVSPGA